MNTNFISSRHVKRENTSLPVDVRHSKTSLLKLPNFLQILKLSYPYYVECAPLARLVLACVAGVKRGRGRGNFSVPERVGRSSLARGLAP